MKFSEMPYSRPDIEATCAKYAALANQVTEA